MVIVHQDPRDKAYPFFAVCGMAAATEKYTQEYVDGRATITGTYRYDHPSVTLEGKGQAHLVYCQDRDKTFDKDIETGRINKTSVSEDSYVLYAAQLRKNDSDLWVTEETRADQGSGECQP